MLRYAPPATISDILRLTTAIEQFDGACDPAFDNDFEELERQFAELRLTYGHE